MKDKYKINVGESEREIMCVCGVDETVGEKRNDVVITANIG